MVSSTSLSVPFLLVLLLCKMTPSFAITASEITAICSSSRNPSFCLDFLKSDPRFASADLAGAAQIAIDVGHTEATDTLNFVQSLVQKTTDPKLQEIFKSCSSNYEEAVGVFEDAKQYLSSKDYSGAGFAVSAALDHAITCNDDSQGTDPSLPQRNENLKSLCSLILGITNRL
ncbi:hypothetical protein Tsubulata_031252 [Turnera subulata]|uniref:Pectinesterase inhibitor domain-containing protein n=1 Tax=Turnera subulata TaxID=218843 RepID=A0A9Q0FI26_9ROSI|nr:hypothetical protein Tsubulata_031252 [Turnera subulata]